MLRIALLILLSTSLHALNLEQIKTEITSELSSTLQTTPQSKPILLLIGGYPGAGKTTLIHALMKSHPFSLISWNDIRQSLLNRHIKDLGHDWEIIQAVNQNLFHLCLSTHSNIVIDANAYSNNIKTFEALLQNAPIPYQLIKICLNPPTETLLQRLRSRQPIPGIHQGTEADLLRDLASPYKKLDMSDYSLIIKNDDAIPLETELQIVESFLHPSFAQQTPN